MNRILFFASLLLFLLLESKAFSQQTVIVSTGAAGWRRVAAILGSDGRSFGQLTIFTSGGDYTPVMSTLSWHHDWNNLAGISVHSDSKSASGYWTQFRITDDGINAYIEVNFSTTVTLLSIMLDDYAWRAATVYTGTLPEGGGAVRAAADRGRLNIDNDLVVGHNGNVGIGTSVPTDKLAVNGNIRAKEVKVEMANWPDFVFAKDYVLPTLQETERHIKEKGHLPGIPSAAEVEKNGIELGEMNKKLLQKIEELTLHLIEQNKTIQKMDKEMQVLKSKIP